jgi:hypothetical protein
MKGVEEINVTHEGTPMMMAIAANTVSPAP